MKPFETLRVDRSHDDMKKEGLEALLFFVESKKFTHSPLVRLRLRIE